MLAIQRALKHASKLPERGMLALAKTCRVCAFSGPHLRGGLRECEQSSSSHTLQARAGNLPRECCRRIFVCHNSARARAARLLTFVSANPTAGICSVCVCVCVCVCIMCIQYASKHMPANTHIRACLHATRLWVRLQWRVNAHMPIRLHTVCQSDTVCTRHHHATQTCRPIAHVCIRIHTCIHMRT
jgi:hypothetical protein